MTLSTTSSPIHIQHPIREQTEARAVSPKQAWADRSWREAAAQMDVEKGTAGGFGHAAREDLEFSDLIDLVNPLQHIPGVAQVYRAITGDTIKPVVKVAGSLLMGGPMGLIAGAGAAVLEAAVGGEPLTKVAAAFGMGGADTTGTTSANGATALAAMPGAGAQTASMQADAQLAHAVTETARDEGPNAQSGPMEISSAADAVLAALAAGANGPAPASVAEAGKRGVPSGRAVTDPAATERSMPLQMPRTNLAQLAAAETARSGGKSIRDYFAEAVPRAVRAPVKPAETEKSAEGARAETPSSAPAPASTAAVAADRPNVTQAAAAKDAAPAAVAAKSAKASVQQQVPPWFADRVLDALDRYQSGAKATTADG